MPAKSEKQRKLFGLAHACKTGKAKMKFCLGKAGKIAQSTSDETIRHFAKKKKR